MRVTPNLWDDSTLDASRTFGEVDILKRSLVQKLIIAILILSAVGGLVALGWFAYNAKKDTDELSYVPVVTSDNTPFKIQPDDPGGMHIPNQDKTIYHAMLGGEKETISKVNTLPPPEEPLDRAALKTTPSFLSSENTEEINALIPPLPDMQAMEEGDGEEITDTPPVIVHKPVPVLRPIRSQTIQQKAVNELQGFKVQLGAYRSTKTVDRGWQTLRKKHTSLLSDLRYSVKTVDLGSKGIYYRLHAGPLETESDARALCKQLVSQGQGCIVVRP